METRIAQEEWEQIIHHKYSESHSQILNKCTSVISEDESKAHTCPWSSYYPFVLGLYPKYCYCHFRGTFSAGELGKPCQMKLKTETGPAPTTALPALPVHPTSNAEGQMHRLPPWNAPGDSMKVRVAKPVPPVSYMSGVSSPYPSPSLQANSLLSAALDRSWAEKP